MPSDPASNSHEFDPPSNTSADPTSPTSEPSRKPASRGTRSEGRRTHPFVIRMTDKEHAEMARQAGRVHLEKAAYVRARIFAYKVPSQRNAIDEENYRALSHLVLDFRNLGGNVNQIAHRLNLGEEVEVTETVKLLASTREALDRVRLHLVQIADDFETENVEVPAAIEWGED